jgi:GNAT superfamily N-acetyltransferase
MRGTAIHVSPASVEAVVATGILDELDDDLLARYPGEPVNGIDPAEFRASGGYFVTASVNGELAGCGAFRPLGASTVEIKRMFVRAPYRGQGIARAVLASLEDEARARGYTESILETAQRMTEAIALYASAGYEVTEPYGQFVGSARSVCMRRTL